MAVYRVKWTPVLGTLDLTAGDWVAVYQRTSGTKKVYAVWRRWEPRRLTTAYSIGDLPDQLPEPEV